MQKYKVFINDKWILFCDYKEEQFSENEEYDVLDADISLVFNLSEMIKKDRFYRNIVLNQTIDTDKFFDYFLKQFIVIEAAGGIVYHSSKAYLLIKRFGVWDFPKGKIEKGENKKEAALREVQEETGANSLHIEKELPTVYHIYRYNSNWIVKRTFWFLMQSDFKGELKPQNEEDILEAIWVPENQMVNYLSNTYASLKELALSFGILGIAKH